MIGWLEEESYNGGTTIRLYDTEIPIDKALIARELVTRWGTVAGQLDGEDSAGRSKIRLATPEELVERACATADLLVEAIKTRGWFIEIPQPKPSRPRGERETQTVS